MANHWRLIALALTLAVVTLSAGCKKKPQAQIVLRDAAVSAWDDSVNVGEPNCNSPTKAMAPPASYE